MADNVSDVVPLSRFRAALARARKGHRADQLLADPAAAQLVPQMPVQELYYAINEVGLADARELYALCTPEQIQGFIDLDCWSRDHIDEHRMHEWIDALVDAGATVVGVATVIDRATGAAQVDANDIGLAILPPLRELDEVAYLRFASVYQAFESLEDFETSITLLKIDHHSEAEA